MERQTGHDVLDTPVDHTRGQRVTRRATATLELAQLQHEQNILLLLRFCGKRLVVDRADHVQSIRMFLHRTHLGAVLPSSGRGKSNLFRDLFAPLVIPTGAVSLASSGFVLSPNANEQNNETIGGFSSFLVPPSET